MIQISSLEKYMYCPRQCALIDVEGRWSDNAHTVRGRRGHRTADGGGRRELRGRTVVRGVPLFSELWGLSGRADAIEMDASGTVTPVEYKIGRRHGRAADVQLCAQALCLEEMLDIEVLEGAVWFSATRRREAVAIDDELRRLTAKTIERVSELRRSEHLPLAPNDERCPECQLVAYCLPTLTDGSDRVAGYVEAML